jgi:hypothetical protein
MRPLIVGAVLLSLSILTVTGQQRTAPNTLSLADIMGATQWRHLKLSFAGQVKNWDLASYEIMQIRESFDMAAKLYPEFKNVKLAELLAAVSEPALVEIDQSVQARDTAAFLRAFDKLTRACNSCHSTAGFGYIVIRVPTSSPFSNQIFVPQ